MTTVYTIPNRPSGSDTRAIAAILTDFDSVLAGMNSFDGGNLQGNSVLAASLADAAKLGLSVPGTKRRDKLTIATEQARTNVAYGKLTTPDELTIDLPADGLLVVGYQALIKNSAIDTGKAALFLGANQLKVGPNGGVGGGPVVQEATMQASSSDVYQRVATYDKGLAISAGNQPMTSDVTTGQALAADQTVFDGGVCWIFAAAGTYVISVQFKSSSGTVTVKERKMWAWSMGF